MTDDSWFSLLAVSSKRRGLEPTIGFEPMTSSHQDVLCQLSYVGIAIRPFCRLPDKNSSSHACCQAKKPKSGVCNASLKRELISVGSGCQRVSGFKRAALDTVAVSNRNPKSRGPASLPKTSLGLKIFYAAATPSPVRRAPRSTLHLGKYQAVTPFSSGRRGSSQCHKRTRIRRSGCPRAIQEVPRASASDTKSASCRRHAPAARSDPRERWQDPFDIVHHRNAVDRESGRAIPHSGSRSRSTLRA